MQFLHSIIGWYIKKRLDEINTFIEFPLESQKKQLQLLLDRGKQTAWGKVHSFASVKSHADFVKTHPIVNYEKLKPWIQKIMDGQDNVLWDGPINWMAKSSGTTADRSKYIPVSKEGMEGHYTGARDTFAMYLHNNPNSGLFRGKGVVLGGSHKVSEWNDDIQYGDLSAVLMKNLHKLPRYLSALSPETAVMENWEEKLDRIAEEALAKRITHIAGVPTWSLLLIKRVLEKTGLENLKEVWPSFELYISGGVSFAPYQNEFNKLLGNENVQCIQTYNASEGFFSIQDQKDSNDMLLLLDNGIYYEFMPMEEYGKPDPKTIPLAEVELGKNYALIISTNSGLWRYLIGDTVRFTSRSPYRIQISGRTKHFINVFGEEVIVDNTDRAIQMTCEALGTSIVEYTVAPVFLTSDSKGAHQWLIEFEKAPKVELVPVSRGTFYRWMKSRGKFGGQNKVPRLSNSRTTLEAILKFSDVEVFSIRQGPFDKGHLTRIRIYFLRSVVNRTNCSSPERASLS